jgi:single-stranded-DNA-specific exonuclease
LQREILSDGSLGEDELNLNVAEILRSGGPWGQGFPEPVFDGVFRLVSRRIVGERHLKLVLQATGGGQTIDAIAFNTVDNDWPDSVEQVEVAYRLDVNEFNGRRSAQLMVDFVRPL